jgi:hypothetical protein
MKPLPTIVDPRQMHQGGLLTLHDLPKAGERKRWTPLYKAIVAEAIKHSVMSPEEACDRYCMAATELKRWIELLETQGVRGLSANNIQPDYVPEKVDDIPSIQDGPLSIDFATQVVRLDGRDMHFTVNQLRLLSILIHRAPMSVSREDVYRLLYANRRGPQHKILDVMICKIRARLGRNMIETVWGRGWRWISPK